MIYETVNPLLIPRLLEMAKSIPDLPIKELEQMLVGGICSADSKVFIDEKDDVIRGFVFSSIEGFDGKDNCFVQVCAIKKEDDSTGFELLNRVKLWAKEKGVEYIYFITKRPRGFERKYKFSYYGTVLRKKVNEEAI